VRKNKSHQEKKGAPKGAPFVLLAWIFVRSLSGRGAANLETPEESQDNHQKHEPETCNEASA